MLVRQQESTEDSSESNYSLLLWSKEEIGEKEQGLRSEME